MFERFTEEARGVIVYAQEEAQMLNHSYIGTEHLLLGLLRDEAEREDGEKPLQSLGVGLEQARKQVVRIVGQGDDTSGGQIPFTPRAKKVLELALREALALRHHWIWPEHILLGMAGENEGVAARILLELDADPERIRDQVIETIGRRPAQPPVPRVVPAHFTRSAVDARWIDGLREVLDQLAQEIRQELGRDPDVGDLLLAMGCARDTVAGEALREIGVDLDGLWGTLERIRQQRAEELETLWRTIDEVRARKDEAIQNQQFKEAAQLRDQERELSEQAHQARSGTVSANEVLEEIRRRLGLPG